jgi:hypothetical protein
VVDLNQWYGLPSIPIAIALVQAFKRTFNWPPAAWPWVAILVAVVWNATLGYLLGYGVWASAVGGIAYGLMSSGLYSAARAHLALTGR